jgi:hypothetical protein
MGDPFHLLLALCLLIVRTPTADEWMPTQKPYLIAIELKTNKAPNILFCRATCTSATQIPEQAICSQPENKFQNRGVFLAAEKCIAFLPP